MSELASAAAISITEDQMSAYVQVVEPEKLETVTPQAVIELLNAHGVVYGLLMENIAKFAENPKQYEKTPLLAAAGTKPVDGKDGYIKNYFANDAKELKPAEQANGKVDMRELLNLNNAAKGQLIAERFPPTEAVPGTTVTGKPVPGKDGKPARWKMGKNVVVNEDQKGMYAVIDGLVTVTTDKKINVFPVYEVNGDVDYRIGNINFIGTVVIRGNVLSGFKVKAAGDIRITGGVEGAEIEAGGSIHIHSGIFAGNKGFVKAGVDVKSSFVQEAYVTAGENIEVTQAILHSNLRAGRSVRCTGKGLIIGGIVQARDYIFARTVGNPMSTATVLEVGAAPELRQELQELTTSLKSLSEQNDKADKALSILDQLAASGTITPDKLELRKKLMMTKRTTEEDIAAVKDRILEIEISLDEISKARIEISGTVYSGAKIVIGRYTRFIKDATTRVMLQLQRGEIVLSSDF